MIDVIQLIFKLGIKSAFLALRYKFHKTLLSKIYIKKYKLELHDIELKESYCDIYKIKNKSFSFFNDFTLQFKQKIVWSLDPISSVEMTPGSHWSTYNFSDVSDIKNVWEISRFNWWLKLCERSKDLRMAEDILEDWIKNNPYHHSAQWTCGQECSIRLINFILGLEIAKRTDLLSDYKIFIEEHLKRIEATHYYAISQNNDHAIVEAAAIFLARLYLNKSYKKSQSNLNRLVQNLFFKDGGFSMFSIFYHRYVSDCLMYVNFLARKKSVELFTNDSIQVLQNSSMFLIQFIVNEQGHTPNLGANDGTNPFSIFSSDYRDFRESISLALLNMFQIRVKDWPYNESLIDIMDFKSSDEIILDELQNQEIYLENFGIYIRRSSKFTFMMRVHSEEGFRPSQEDLSHIELWSQGKNVLLDSGTYSYRYQLGDEIKSLDAHNSLSECGIENMRVFSKFLYKDWPNKGKLEVEKNSIKYTFKNFSGSEMSRLITFQQESLEILDHLSKKSMKIVFNVNPEFQKVKVISHQSPEIKKAFHSPNYNQLAEHERLIYISHDTQRTKISLEA